MVHDPAGAASQPPRSATAGTSADAPDLHRRHRRPIARRRHLRVTVAGRRPAAGTGGGRRLRSPSTRRRPGTASNHNGDPTAPKPSPGGADRSPEPDGRAAATSRSQHGARPQAPDNGAHTHHSSRPSTDDGAAPAEVTSATTPRDRSSATRGTTTAHPPPPAARTHTRPGRRAAPSPLVNGRADQRRQPVRRAVSPLVASRARAAAPPAAGGGARLVVAVRHRRGARVLGAARARGRSRAARPRAWRGPRLGN